MAGLPAARPVCALARSAPLTRSRGRGLLSGGGSCRLMQACTGLFLLTIKQAGRARRAPRSVYGKGIATRSLFGLKFSGRNARLRASSKTVFLLFLAPVPAPCVCPRASGEKLERFPRMPLSGRAELGRIRSQGWEGKFARSCPRGARRPRSPEEEGERSGGEQGCRRLETQPLRVLGEEPCLRPLPAYSGSVLISESGR